MFRKILYLQGCWAGVESGSEAGGRRLGIEKNVRRDSDGDEIEYKPLFVE